MKKVLFFATALAVLSLSSCKKTASCESGGSKVLPDCEKCNAAAIKAYKTSCSAYGGTYSK